MTHTVGGMSSPQAENYRAQCTKDLRAVELAEFFALYDGGWTFDLEGTPAEFKVQEFFPSQDTLLEWGNRSDDMSDKFALRVLNLIHKELRELRQDIKSQQRRDYSFLLGCACLGVLVLLLFK